MKSTLLILVFSISALSLIAQEPNISNVTQLPCTGTFLEQQPKENAVASEINLEKSFFNEDCSSDFWTVDATGNIQEWSLVNGVVTGGNVILTNSGSGIGFCGDTSSATFYTSQYPNTGITYYDTISGWTNIAFPMQFTNNAGHGYDQYYYGYTGSNNLLYHFDGSVFTLVDSIIPPMYLTAADLAVDGMGRAWIFKGSASLSTTQLDLYDITGVVASYPITFNAASCYGAIFLNDTLYLGFGTNGVYNDELVPVTINGGSAVLGVPIPFQNNAFYDMASCQNSSTQTNSLETKSKSSIRVYPNPAHNILTIDGVEKWNEVKLDVFSTYGDNVFCSEDFNMTLDISKLSYGVYFVRIQEANKTHIIRFIKE